MDDLSRIHMHRLACERNTLPCAPSILKHRVSSEVCLLGHQWISRGSTLRKVQYYPYTRSRKIHWTLITQEMREDLQIDFFSRETFFGRCFGTLPRNVSIQNPPPPPPNRFLFGLGRPIRYMLLIFRDDRSTTLFTRMGLF